MNTTFVSIDEGMMQLMRMMNRLLDKAPETRRRNLSFHTPVIVPIWPQARPHPAALRARQADHSSSVVVTGNAIA